MANRSSGTARVLSVLCVLVANGSGCAEPLPAHVEAARGHSSERGAYADLSLYVEADSRPADQAELWRTSDPAGAAVMDELADQHNSLWLGGWMSDPGEEVDDALDRAGNRLQSFVVYNIPNRDCGNFSAGGAGDVSDYAGFIDDVADGFEGRLGIVILEPDALALDDCLDSAGKAERARMLSDAVDTLTDAGAAVYLDAGDSNWIDDDDMADRLLDAGVDRAAGFALNVAHTETNSNEISYALRIRDIIGDDAHYVIDTGRNGLGPTSDSEWCNPEGRGTGRKPTLRWTTPGLDALLWVKRPGNSDGWCNGGPEAGDWWPEYARELAENSPY